MANKFSSNEVIIKLNTGDLLLCYNKDNNIWYDFEINNMKYSPISHVGMVIRDPSFKEYKANGLYVLEIVNHELGLKNRVKLTPFDDFIKDFKRIDARCWNTMLDKNIKKLNDFYDKISGKNYKSRCCIRRYDYEKYFWGPELIATCYYNMGLLTKTKEFENYNPNDFIDEKIVGLSYGLGSLSRLF
tara:strand:- start:392 stop:952 length:561 start_codon:yes stop_codon:yes gene_type:complete